MVVVIPHFTSCVYAQIWLPPTPPSDDTEDLYVDLVLEMSYDTQSTMSTVFLASTFPYRWAATFMGWMGPHSCVHMRGYMLCFALYCSEDDYDVFGLWRKNTVAGKLSSKELSKDKQK